MKLYTDFHTHTRYSHGKGSIKDNVAAAQRKGLAAVGISDHGPANLFIGTKLDDFKRMRDEIEELKPVFGGIQILLGCEANIISIDGEIDIPDHILKELDYCMVGFHPMIWPRRWRDIRYLTLDNILSRGLKFFKEKALQNNTDALIRAMENHKIHIITHPGYHLPIDTARLAAAAARFGTALEINAGHGYMTTAYVKIAQKQGAKFAIGSDAHRPEDVGNFDRGIEIAEQAGITASDIINARLPNLEVAYI
jgi:putative hydrolase